MLQSAALAVTLEGVTDDAEIAAATEKAMAAARAAEANKPSSKSYGYRGCSTGSRRTCGL